MIKLLVVDQHPIVTKGLEVMFNATRDINCVGFVNNGEAVFEYLEQTPVDVILTEIDLPKLNGISVLKRMKSDFPNVKVIIFSALPESVYALSLIKAGAHGFIPKSASLSVIKQAIFKVNTDGLYLSDEFNQRLKQNTKDLKGITYYKKLSTRELEVLKLLASGKRNKDIAKALAINEKTVSTYRARLMKKLKADNLLELVNISNTVFL